MVEELEMRLNSSLSANGPLEEAKGTIASLVKKSNEELFAKGLPAGKVVRRTEITRWETSKSSLTLEIISGAYARAPAALMRFRKALAEALGTKHKIGIRSVSILDFQVRIPSKVADAAAPRIRRLEYVKSAESSGQQILVDIKPMTESDLKRNVPDRVVGTIQGLLNEISQKEERAPSTVSAATMSLYRKGVTKGSTFEEDPSKIGLERGWFKEFPGRGQWIYTTPYAKLIEVIEGIIYERLLQRLDFQPFMLPKLIPLEVMKSMPGYLEEIPEGMYYVCSPPRDPEAFSKFKQILKATREVPRDILKSIVNEPAYVLAPAQCEPFWQFFGRETVREEDLPIKLYDRSGWTYRWEGGGVEGLTRVQEFRRIELGYLGTPQQVVDTRDELRDNIVKIVDEEMDLEWRVVAAAPFYLKGEDLGDISDSKNVAAFDVEVYLPYRGQREKAEWLEIAACFIHKTKFVDSFKIRELKKRDIWTGCCGIGISRWAAAFLARHGFKTENWPKTIREKFGTYTLPRTVMWPKKKSE